MIILIINNNNNNNNNVNNNNNNAINVKGVEFLQELGRRLAAISDNNRQTSFLFQRISITLQRFNAITSLIHLRKLLSKSQCSYDSAGTEDTIEFFAFRLRSISVPFDFLCTHFIFIE